VIPTLVKYVPTKASIEEMLAADKPAGASAAPTGEEMREMTGVEEDSVPSAEPVGAGVGGEDEPPF
jgi:hypothetical protein